MCISGLSVHSSCAFQVTLTTILKSIYRGWKVIQRVGAKLGQAEKKVGNRTRAAPILIPGNMLLDQVCKKHLVWQPKYQCPNHNPSIFQVFYFLFCSSNEYCDTQVSKWMQDPHDLFEMCLSFQALGGTVHSLAS